MERLDRPRQLGGLRPKLRCGGGLRRIGLRLRLIRFSGIGISGIGGRTFRGRGIVRVVDVLRQAQRQEWSGEALGPDDPLGQWRPFNGCGVIGHIACGRLAVLGERVDVMHHDRTNIHRTGRQQSNAIREALAGGDAVDTEQIDHPEDLPIPIQGRVGPRDLGVADA